MRSLSTQHMRSWCTTRKVADVWEKGHLGVPGPSLGVQVLAVFSFISQGKSQFEECLEEHLEVPDILLPSEPKSHIRNR